MGCDGGTIPKRDELVKVKKKPEQKDKVSELSFRWQHCSISQEPLRKPIVACGLGRLYNKDAVIEKLLDKATMPETMSHIKRLRDIKDLNLTANPVYKEETEKGNNHVDRQAAPYICPISGLEMSGKFKFCFFWTCGCVLSERAMKQFQEKLCLSCQKPFTDDDIVVLNAADEDLELMISRNKLRQKSNNKKVKVKIEPNDESEPSTSFKVEKMSLKKEKDIKVEKVDASVTANSSKRALDEMYDPAYKKTKKSYSVAKDPSATDVYKSLFTTHKGAKLTYNPF